MLGRKSERKKEISEKGGVTIEFGWRKKSGKMNEVNLLVEK